jgi:hypothetical protein
MLRTTPQSTSSHCCAITKMLGLQRLPLTCLQRSGGGIADPERESLSQNLTRRDCTGVEIVTVSNMTRLRRMELIFGQLVSVNEPRLGFHPHFSQDCRPDRASPMRAGTSVAISDAVSSQAVTTSKAGLRCSGNDLRPAVRPTVRNPG